MTVNATFRLIPATEPTITTQPSNLSLTYGYMSGNVLTVAADSIDGHSLSYQWYSNTTDSNEGGTAINSATAASYTVPAGKSAGTTEYYYCVVTAKRNDNNQTAETKSNVATVTIGKATPDITTPPTASSITYGQTLNDSNLSDGAATTSGTFAWTNSSTTPAVSDSNTTEYGVTFTPSDTTNYNSATTTVTLTVNPKSVSIPTAVTGLKYTGSEQTGVAGGDGYTVENGTGTNVDSYTATATLTSTTNYKWSDGTTDAREISWSIAKADGPAAPTGLTGVAPTSSGASDGKITGVTTAMEYSEDGTDYTPCTGTEITGLTAGTYYVRTAATETQDAGAAAAVNVPAYRAPSSGGGGAPATYPVTINGIDGGTVKPDKPTAAKGDKVTLTVTSDAGLEPTSVTVTDKNGKEVPVTDNGDGTYTFAMPAGAVSVTAAFQEAEAPADGSCKRDATCPISVFDDASPAGWYHDGVHYVLAEGIMQGTGATTFAPNSPTTRGDDRHHALADGGPARRPRRRVWRRDGRQLVRGRGELGRGQEDRHGLQRRSLRPQRQRDPGAVGGHPVPLRAVQGPGRQCGSGYQPPVLWRRGVHQRLGDGGHDVGLRHRRAHRQPRRHPGSQGQRNAG